MRPENSKDRFRISEEAALWLIRLEQDGTPQCRAQFAAWARQSPVHVEEFLFAQATSQHLDRMDPERKIDLTTLDAGSEAGAIIQMRQEDLRLGPNPAALTQDFSAEQGSHSGKARKVSWSLIGLAASVAIAVAGWLLLNAGAQTYSTAIGDQQAIKLRDGSVMHMNTHSRVEIHFDEQARNIRLLEGEALFVVARDPARPFRVMTDGARIQAIGTQFNVYRRAGSTRVSVVEGAVSISPLAGADIKPLKLTAGNEADLTHGRIAKVATSDVLRAVAWRARRLMFQADPLEKVVAEFNRYDNRRPIRLEGGDIRRRAVSGVFDADDPEPLLEFLEADAALQVTRTAEEIVIRSSNATEEST